MQDPVSLAPVWLLAPVMALSLLLMRVQQSRPSPVLAICNRWLRWVAFAGGSALVVSRLEWSGHAYGTLFVAGLIGWFLLETVYHWLAIHAMSVSPLPLFPRYALNPGGDEWPVQPVYLRLRERIRSENFKFVQALRSEIASGIHLRASFYQTCDARVRLQVVFLPQPTGQVAACLQFSTHTADGRRIVTDNHHLPFAGFYPDNWLVERKPWSRSFSRLFARHRRRVDKLGAPAVPWTSEPLEDLNAQQSRLEHLNTELGFLLPASEHEEHGRISGPGRYRIWKELLTLNYLGRAIRYD